MREEATAGPQTHSRWTWRRVLSRAALADLVVMAITGLFLRDPEALALAGAILVGILFLEIRGGIAGVVMLLVLSADVAFFMLPAFASNAAHRENLAVIMIPASLGIISLSGVVAALASLSRRHPSPGGRVAALVPQAAIAAFAVALIAGFVQQQGHGVAVAQPGDVRMEIRSIEFIPKTITVPAGQTTFALHNGDLFWHTFTIDSLHLNADTPIGGRRRVSVNLLPGTYEYFCRVPGHRAAGMKGTLIVR